MQTNNIFPQPIYMNLQPNFVQQPEQVPIQPTQFGSIIQFKVPVGTINKNTGRLTFQSSSLLIGIVLIIIVFPLCLSQFVTINSYSRSEFIPFTLLIFLLPALLFLVVLIYRKHVVEFDDNRREMILSSHFMIFPCIKRVDSTISYDHIQDIYCEIFGTGRANVVCLTKDFKMFIF